MEGCLSTADASRPSTSPSSHLLIDPYLPAHRFTMCIDGENAAHISEYINTQLLGLYKIAVDCSIHHNETPRYDAGGQLVKSSTLPGYDTALAEYHSKGGELHATFGPPSVRFVCNHNAIVRLDVQSATLTADGEAVANASSRQAVRGTK